MNLVNLPQCSDAWLAHRATKFNASDAPAMLGISPYKSRTQLLRERATGITPEIDANTQRLFDAGHRFEALARPIAEKIIGSELFPCVGELGQFSASFDGVTLTEDTLFEHKSLNETIRAAINGGIGNAVCLPDYLRVQMEHQLMVSGAERVLFMASRWDGDELVEELHCWYYPDMQLRDHLIAGWLQFATDLAVHVPEVDVLPAPAGRAPDQMPALHIEVTGMVTASNLAQWKEAAVAVFQGISSDLHTDQDFADAEKTVKWCGDIEDQLKAAKQHALSQTASIDELFRTIDAISAEARVKRLELDKLVKARKESLRGEIVAAGVASVREHYDTINATMGQHSIQPTQSVTLDIGAAIKGKKSITSMRDAVDSASAAAKIEASQRAERVRANVAIIEDHVEHRSLFADAVQLCATKAPEDLRNLITARIADHQQREASRLEAEREKIRQEEVARIEREQADQEARAAKEAQASQPAVVAAPAPAATVSASPARVVAKPAASAVTGVRINLTEINARIAPLSITADGLAQLGLQPASIERTSKFYLASSFPMICAKLAALLTDAAMQKAA